MIDTTYEDNLLNRTINPFVYKVIMEENMRNPTLPAFLKQSYAQHYEDVILESILRSRAGIGRFKDQPLIKTMNLSYLEIGANHPCATSSSYLLYKKYGIRGTLVDANAELVFELQKHRQGDNVVYAAVTTTDDPTVSFYISKDTETSSLSEQFVMDWKGQTTAEKVIVPALRVNDLLKLHVNTNLILFIDVESFDLDIIKDIDFTIVRPYIIQAETNEWNVPGTRLEMITYLAGKGYKVSGDTDCNLIFEDAA